MIELPRETVTDSVSIEDIISYRHWHAQSEPYGGGDSLTTALYLGWTMGDVVYLEEHWLAGTRRVSVYHFELMRDNVSMIMPVIGNPYIDRLIFQTSLQVMPIQAYTSDVETADVETRI